MDPYQQQLDLLEAIIGSHPGGLLRKDIERIFAERTDMSIGQRTLLRRLSCLIDDGRVVKVGDRKSTRYLPPQPATQDDLLPVMSEGALELQTKVSLPIARKKRVGYTGDLLDQYRPGHTWYLDAASRRRLHEMGSTFDEWQPAGTFARAILDRLLIDLSWASSHLEGNTYTLLDTSNLIRFGQEAEAGDAAETQMILNHKQAIELLVSHADEVGFNRYTFLNLHATLSQNLLPNPSDEGTVRSKPVDIMGSVYVPLAIPQAVDQRFDQILHLCDAIDDPFEQAFFLMVHIPYLQPFMDCNKRLSRVGANLSLVMHNLCPLSFLDVPKRAYLEATLAVYEFRAIDYLRDVFLWAYERSCEQYTVVRDAMAEPDRFRLKYRNELARTVREIVVGKLPPRRSHIRDIMGRAVTPEDTDAYVEMALREVINLHAGNFARYRIRPSEFEAWWHAVKPNH